MLTYVLASLALAAPPADAEDAPATEQETPVEGDEAKPWDRVGWGFGGVPAVNYNSDEGFGFGAVASVYRYDGETGPYKTATTLILFMTTKAIHGHSLEMDMLRVGGLPLRLTLRGALDSTKVDNYCGIGSAVTCDPAVAEAAATQAGLAGDAFDDFVRRYYRTRYIFPNWRIDARYALDPMPHRFEIIANYSGSVLIPGDFKERGPWPGSLYEEDFGDGEQGYMGVFQLGAMLDNRDNEPSPTRGYWIEASVRGAPGFLGSDWEYVGFNTTLRGYVPVFTERLVLAERVVVDALSGDASIRELATPGGSQRYTGYGSLNAGRGIRQRRFIGKTFAMSQTELRFLALPFEIAGVPIDIHVLGFADVGFVGAEFSDFGRMFSTPLPGGGGGLRVAVDKNFVVRADAGFSAYEPGGPSIYIDLRNVF